jgi:transposase
MFDSIFQNQIYELSKQGHSIRAIAKKLEISRQSVRKYIKGFQKPKPQDSFRNYLKNNKETIKKLFFEMNGHCVPLLRKITETYNGKANLRGLQIFCKQFRKELKNRDETTPCRYETQPGDHLQIDFGEQDVIIGGNSVRIHFFVSVLAYSRRIYVKAFTAENTEAWLNGIENSFRHFGGVPLAIISDNTKCLVTVHNGNELKFNERYKAFCHYWNVKPVACTPYKPRSKGKCERMVRYFKENALPGKEFNSLDDLQKWIDLWLVKYSDVRKLSMVHTTGADTPAERFVHKERHELREINKVFFTSIREEIRKADKCGLIRIENKLYQIPKTYADKKIMVQITDTEIIFHDPDNRIIRMDKATSFYTTKLQEKSTTKMFNDISDDYEIWGNNSLSRSLNEYTKVTGGTW